jgi:large subunit ribosomal protein L19
MDLLREFELQQIKNVDRPRLKAGDIVRVGMKVKEGDKVRVQTFEGTVIGVRGSGPSTTFTVRREVGKFGVERIFPLYNPLITEIDIVKRQKVRRAKLNYLRQAGRRRVKEDELAMQRHIHQEQEKVRLAEEAKKRAEEKKTKEEAAKKKAEAEKPTE